MKDNSKGEEEMIPDEAKHYTMIIQWSDEDQAYIVSVPELPGCKTHGDTYEEAVKQGEDAIESWIMDALADNEPIPPPQKYAA
jgi:predicted RNase H-like HicB family nuclease